MCSIKCAFGRFSCLALTVRTYFWAISLSAARQERAFLFGGGGTTKRESIVGAPPKPAQQYVLCYVLPLLEFILICIHPDF